MAFPEDLPAFFDTSSGFAVPAVWKNAVAVDGIFENDYVEDLAGTIAGLESRVPAFICAEEDVDGVLQGDDFEVDGVAYRVAGVQPDGTGLVRLRLERV